ncbi:penicillin-binding protein 1A [Marinimicrobium locisalis]|uniref:penicillin-binding protein 1A n=1 Tax=Marinimicrobium locisalis TaxID=546022 RepID=UPI003221F048
MPIKKSYLSLLFWLFVAGSGASLVGLAGLYLYLSPKLPPVESLRQVQLQTPLRVYSSDEKLIGEFGEQRRTPLSFEELPDQYIKALLSAEDAEFYDHSGVSIRGLLRAASQLLKTGAIQSGGSTLTMQLARDFFLSRDQVFSRKFNEILLALQIENELSKEEILELFSNKMFFGNRAYGIQAAAQIYYGKDADELKLHQWAMIVGVLKAPSAYNPLANLERAMIRRNWILGRMLELGHIDQATYEVAVNTPDNARYHGATLELYAPYIAELARREAIDRFGDEAYTAGYKVYTTIHSRYQAAAQMAVVEGLMTYDWRHGYRGPEAQWGEPPKDLSTWVEALDDLTAYGDLEPAVVTAVEDQSAEVLLDTGETLELGWDQGLSTARRYINENARGAAPKTASDVVSVGDLIRLYQREGAWHLRQIPEAQAALVGLDPENGAMRSLVGGFDFHQSNFNRALQAERQPGSSFKPFVYTAALKNGFTPATLVNDSPIVIEDASLEGAWRPENDGGTFLGPTRLREALYRSRNLVSIRVLRSIGIDALLETLGQFGFEPEKLPRNLSLALGSHALTPLEMARGYAIFANGGYRVEPYLVERIENVEGEPIHQARPLTVCRECDRQLREEREPESLVADIFTEPPSPEASSSQWSEVDDKNDTVEPETPLDQPTQLMLLDEADAVIPPPIAPRVLDEQTAYIIDSMLRDVISRGTGRRARVLDRSDIGGKTGTTNGPIDAWFAGYSPHIVTVAWLGFDHSQKLGRGEYGGSAALPIWINYMRTALSDKPERVRPQPEGIVTVRIDPENGRRARPGDPDAIFEIFRAEEVPPYDSNGNGGSTREAEQLPEELF